MQRRLIFLVSLLFAATSSPNSVAEETAKDLCNQHGIECVDYEDSLELPYKDGPDYFCRFEKALFLADGTHSPSLASKAAEKCPNLRVLRTDIRLPASETLEGRYVAMPFDVNADFGILPTSGFGIVVMENGLCQCNTQMATCAGLNLDILSLSRFFAQVAAALEKGGEAWLLGNLPPHTLPVWKAALSDLQDTNAQFITYTDIVEVGGIRLTKS